MKTPIKDYFGNPVVPVPRMEIGKWFVQLNLEPEYGRGSRQVCLNWNVERDYWFGYSSDWYDGPHKAFVLGPVNLYWNW